MGKSSDTRSCVKDSLSRCTPQDGLLASELSSSLKEVRFSKQEFSAGISVSDIKYHYSGSQNNNSFYPFNDQLDYAVTTYFVESETTKGNVDRFLCDLLIAPLTKKLYYRNTNEWIEKLSNILWSIPNNK